MMRFVYFYCIFVGCRIKNANLNSVLKVACQVLICIPKYIEMHSVLKHANDHIRFEVSMQNRCTIISSGNQLCQCLTINYHFGDLLLLHYQVQSYE